MLSPHAAARLDAFVESKIGHSRLVAATKSVQTFIHSPAGSAVLLVIGPTGVGKSTLLDRLVELVTDDLLIELNADPQRLPPVIFDCPPPVNGTYSWTDWYHEGLKALKDLSPREHALVAADPRLPIQAASRSSLGALREAFLGAVEARRPAAIGIDEAQQLTGVGHGQRLLTQFDHIKSLGGAANVPFVLVGTYDLLALRNVSGQLGRRCQEVHLSRYKITDPDDWAAFRSSLLTFAKQLEIDPDILLKRAERMYAGCCGCVGTLKQWLTRAFVVALQAGRELTWEDIEATSLPLSTLIQIASEIASGEESMLETADQEKELHEFLGMTGTKSRRAKSGRWGRVGRRAPGHDKVGKAA